MVTGILQLWDICTNKTKCGGDVSLPALERENMGK